MKAAANTAKKKKKARKKTRSCRRKHAPKKIFQENTHENMPKKSYQKFELYGKKYNF